MLHACLQGDPCLGFLMDVQTQVLALPVVGRASTMWDAACTAAGYSADTAELT
jgi:hypothetical protein